MLTFILPQQVKEAKQVSVIWRRGKSELESKTGVIDPETHDAKIDDIFKMKTSVEFDITDYKFQSKMSILELIFHQNKQAVGHIEFDLGWYANMTNDQTKKKFLDLKSETYPGSQIYIYVAIKVLEPLTDMQMKAIDQSRKSVMYP